MLSEDDVGCRSKVVGSSEAFRVLAPSTELTLTRFR